MGVNVVLDQSTRAAATARSAPLGDGTKLTASLIVCTVGDAPHLSSPSSASQERCLSSAARSWWRPPVRWKVMTSYGQQEYRLLVPDPTAVTARRLRRFAHRQGQLIGDNLAALLHKKPLKTFTFTGLGELASIGHHMAVANIAGANFAGIIAWFTWRTIYLMKLPGFDRKLRVMTEWAFELFFPRDISLLTPSIHQPAARDAPGAGRYPLFESGEPAFSLYAVKKGRVDITDANGDVVKSAGPGDHFGERALLGDRTLALRRKCDREQRAGRDRVARALNKLITIDSLLPSVPAHGGKRMPLPEQVGPQTVASMAATVRDGSVADVMTRDVAVIRADAAIHDAIDEFQRHPHGTYPVLDGRGSGARPAAPRLRPTNGWNPAGLDGQHTVRDIALTRPFIIQATTAIRDLVEDFMHTGATKALVAR